MQETAEVMAGRLTAIAAELKAAGRKQDATAVLAGALAIYLDQVRGAAGGAAGISVRANA